MCVAVADGDNLAAQKKIALKELKGRSFIGIDEEQMPGRNQWMSALCKTTGFKPRFAVIIDGITNVLSLVASENAVTLLPAYFQEFTHPGIVFVPISDPRAKWDFIVLWQSGKVPASTHALVHELKESAARFAGATHRSLQPRAFALCAAGDEATAIRDDVSLLTHPAASRRVRPAGCLRQFAPGCF